jgi:hypothetical protein
VSDATVRCPVAAIAGQTTREGQVEHQYESPVIVDLGDVTELTAGAEPKIVDTDIIGIGSV